MKKIVALVLAMVMVLGLAAVAFAYEDGDNFYSTKTQVDGVTVEYTYVEASEYVPGEPNNVAYLTTASGTDFAIVTSKGAPLYFDGKKADIQLGDELETLAPVTYLYKGEACQASAWSCHTDRHAAGYAFVNEFGVTQYAVKVDADEAAFNLYVGGTLVPVILDPTYVPGQHVLAAKDGEPEEIDVGVYKAYCVACKDDVKISHDNISGAGYLYTFGQLTPEFLDEYGLSAARPAGYEFVTGTYFVVGETTSAGANGSTVESAKTFDAGIAMYVGMSVMAAAGSAVVLKKKD